VASPHPPGRPTPVSEVCLTRDTLGGMDSVSVRDLRNHGGDVLDRVARGEAVLVTRDGTPVAELRPCPRPAPRPAELVASRRRLPRVDLARLRADLDALLDSTL
jgi:prevent-host-death family protein